jgi:hypothetical protein
MSEESPSLTTFDKKLFHSWHTVPAALASYITFRSFTPSGLIEAARTIILETRQQFFERKLDLDIVCDHQEVENKYDYILFGS